MKVVGSENRNYAFDRDVPPVLELEPGETVTFEVEDDTWTRLAAGTVPDELPGFNPVVGPVFVHGARPGDALRIDIAAIEVRAAWATWMPDFGPLGNRTRHGRVMSGLWPQTLLRMSFRLRSNGRRVTPRLAHVAGTDLPRGAHDVPCSSLGMSREQA